MAVDISALRTAIPYIRGYKNKVFVVKLGGELCIPGPSLDHVVEQCSLLYQLGVKIIVVHGGGPQANQLGKQLGVSAEVINGRRVTSAEMLEVAKMCFAGTVNTDLIAACRKQEIPVVGLSGIDGKLITVRKRPVGAVVDVETGKSKQVDFGYVGDVTNVDIQILKDLLANGYMPVIASLACDEQGQVYNVNADTVAARIAIAAEATKYFVISRVDGVLRNINDRATLISELDIEEIQNLIETGVVNGGMVPKLTNCIEVVQSGIPRAHIVNGLEPDTLLKEIFTNEGCGTLVVRKRA